MIAHFFLYFLFIIFYILIESLVENVIIQSPVLKFYFGSNTYFSICN